MTTKELKILLSRVNNNIRICIETDNDPQKPEYSEVTGITMVEAHFINKYGNEEWGNFLKIST